MRWASESPWRWVKDFSLRSRSNCRRAAALSFMAVVRSATPALKVWLVSPGPPSPAWDCRRLLTVLVQAARAITSRGTTLVTGVTAVIQATGAPPCVQATRNQASTGRHIAITSASGSANPGVMKLFRNPTRVKRP